MSSGSALNYGAGAPGRIAVRIDILDKDDQAGTRFTQAGRRGKLVLGNHAMQPDHGSADADLAMDHSAFAILLHTTRIEPKSADEQ